MAASVDIWREVLSDLELYGVPARLLKGKSLFELHELRLATLRQLMKAPRAAA